MKVYPLQFQPVYKDYLWGGHRIQKEYARFIAHEKCAESWEISDRDDGMSVIVNGEYQGSTLAELIEEFPIEIVGYDVKRFPLLIKIIDAMQNLSIQVHPDQKTAKAFNAEPKTEMWYVLYASTDALIYLGLAEHICKEEFIRCIEKNEIENCINKYHPKRGDVFFIPAGHVHAIGSGCMLYECQQNSNTTYRVYDWNRLGPDKKPRPLHIHEAINSIHFGEEFSYLQKPIIEVDEKNLKVQKLVSCTFFTIRKLQLQLTQLINKNTNSFHFLFLVDGIARVIVNDELVQLNKGDNCLIPAICDEYVIQALSEATILQSSVE